MWAASKGYKAIVYALIAAGADVNDKDRVSAGVVMGGGVSDSSG